MPSTPDTGTFARTQLQGLEHLMRLGETEVEPPAVVPCDRKPGLIQQHGFRFSKFAVIGALVFVAGTALQWPLLRVIGADWSYVTQSVLSVELSYLLNWLWTWRDRETRGSFWKWNAQRIAIMLPNLGLYDVIVHYGLNWLEANVIATGAFIVITYLLADKWSFVGIPHASAVAVAERETVADAVAAPEPRRSWRDRFRFLATGPWPLLGILVVQAGLSLRLIWRNTAFNDEALYLWSGHWEIAHLLQGTPIPQFQTYFSGAPVVYPVLAAVADSYGGLALARILSLVFMLAATGLCYLTARRLFSARAATIAAALFSGLGSVQFLGSFATYDAMALLMLVASACLVVHARSWWSEPLLITAAIVLVLGDASKYATGLWDPAVIVLAGVTATGSWRRDALRSARLAVYVALLIVVAMRLGGHAYLVGLDTTTLARSQGGDAMFGIFKNSAEWIGLVVLVALRSIVIARGRREQLLCGTLCLAALLAPLEQARIHSDVSLEKHVAFGAWFAAIAGGHVLADALSRSKYARWRLPALTVAAVTLTGFFQATYFDDGWASVAPALAEVRHVLRESRGPVLAEDAADFNYYLRLAPHQVINASAFYYIDPKDGRPLRGDAAYAQAIRQHYFSLIEVDHVLKHADKFIAARNCAVCRTAGFIATHVSASAFYRLVAAIPWRSSLGHGVMLIWVHKEHK
jgi:putative flippase GtrA